MFSKVDYIKVNVSDMSRSVAFYRDILGLSLKFESPEWSEFQTGATTLALHLKRARVGGEGRAPPEPLAGTCSIGFSVEDLAASPSRSQRTSLGSGSPRNGEAFLASGPRSSTNFKSAHLRGVVTSVAHMLADMPKEHSAPSQVLADGCKQLLPDWPPTSGKQPSRERVRQQKRPPTRRRYRCLGPEGLVYKARPTPG
jgi:catechol 2,3-dioxygenase-like lactoylglutathione lyase family enzyme